MYAKEDCSSTRTRLMDSRRGVLYTSVDALATRAPSRLDLFRGSHQHRNHVSLKESTLRRRCVGGV